MPDVVFEERLAHPSASATLSSTVVICAYDGTRWPRLREAILAVGAQQPRPAEIIVVVDHNDDLLERARTELAEARVVANEERSGLSGARNTGVRHAQGDIVVFLDDDARPRPGWLSSLLEGFSEASVIGAGGVAWPDWAGPAPAWLPPEFWWVIGCSYRGLPTGVVEIRNPIGANMAFRRSVFELVGGFTDGIGRVGRTPLGCEETEFSIRARTATGGRILHHPSAAVDHAVPVDRARWEYFRRRCWAEGISKALVAGQVGARDALASERAYVRRALPAGIVRNLAQAARGDVAALACAAAIVAGFAITAAGYGRGFLARLRAGALG